MGSMAGKYLNLDSFGDDWQATDIATLLFVLKDEDVLLIRKKRGLGAGKINGPGGKLEPGETPRQCAIREVREELCISVLDTYACGELRFQFTDGYSIHVHVFTSTRFEGEPAETDEAVPMWFRRSDIPYAEMWADDRIWLPRVLDGSTVNGKFIFSKDILLSHEVHFE